MKYKDKSLYSACQKVRPQKKEASKVEMEDQGEKNDGQGSSGSFLRKGT